MGTHFHKTAFQELIFEAKRYGSCTKSSRYNFGYLTNIFLRLRGLRASRILYNSLRYSTSAYPTFLGLAYI